jgi:hypothetical protein
MNSEPRLETRKPPTRAKWRSSSSACLSALKKCLTLPTLLEMGFIVNHRSSLTQEVDDSAGYNMGAMMTGAVVLVN